MAALLLRILHRLQAATSHGVFSPCKCLRLPLYIAHCATTQAHVLLPLLLSGPMSADHLAAPRSPLDVLEDEILTSIMLAAAGSENQQHQEQQQYLYGIFPLVCKRFHRLLSGSCSSVLVPPTAEDQPPPLFASWLSRHGSRLQKLTIPAKLLAAVAVAAQQPPVLPSLSNLRSLQLTGTCPEQVVSALQPLSNLRYNCLAEVSFSDNGAQAPSLQSAHASSL